MRIVVNLPLGANLDPETLSGLIGAGQNMENRYRTICADVYLVLQSCRESRNGEGETDIEYFTATLHGRLPSSITPALIKSLLSREE